MLNCLSSFHFFFVQQRQFPICKHQRQNQTTTHSCPIKQIA